MGFSELKYGGDGRHGEHGRLNLGFFSFVKLKLDPRV